MSDKKSLPDATADELKKKLTGSLTRGKELGDSVKRQSVLDPTVAAAAATAAANATPAEKKTPEAGTVLYCTMQ